MNIKSSPSAKYENIDLDNKLLQAIRDLGRMYAVQKIVLLGSRAKGNNRPTSDIDLAVYPLPGFTGEGKLAANLDDLDTLLKIDVVFITSDIDQRLIKNIEKEGVILYERLL
ncbi:MAG: nucleotidyltransferase family protein [Peptococcales bacterium]